MKSVLNVTGASSDTVQQKLEESLFLEMNFLFSESFCEVVHVAYGEEAVEAARQRYAARFSGCRATEAFGDVIFGNRESTLRSNRFPATTRNVTDEAGNTGFLLM